MSAGIITVCQRQRCMRGFTPSTRIGAKSSPPTERGESYSTLAGFFKQYELVYVVGDERDLVRLRTSYREPREDVYVHRAQVPRENVRRLFLDYVRRINELHDERPVSRARQPERAAAQLEGAAERVHAAVRVRARAARHDAPLRGAPPPLAGERAGRGGGPGSGFLA